MGAKAVQVNRGQRYEKTTDPRRMMTHKLLNEAICTDWETVRGFLPARTATLLSYERGATRAKARNAGEGEVSIDLPLKDGWYVPDGNPFAIPNGRKSSVEDPEALYLCRYQDRDFSGPVGRADVLNYYSRFVLALGVWSNVSGVAIIGRSAAAPLETATGTGLQLIRNPTELIVRGTPEQLEAAVQMLESLK